MTTQTNKTANIVTMTNKTLGSQAMTWDDANFTWNQGNATWDNPIGVANKTANTTILKNKLANV